MAEKNRAQQKREPGSAAPSKAAGSGGVRAKGSNSFDRVLDSLMEGAGGVISSKTVVGEPIVVGDTTLIPLNDVTIGAGAGSNVGEGKDAGMGGFTAKLSPSAVLVLKNGVTKVVNIRNQDSVSKLVDMVPEVIDRILEQKTVRSMMDDEEAEERAFPEEKNGAKKNTNRKNKNSNKETAVSDPGAGPVTDPGAAPGTETSTQTPDQESVSPMDENPEASDPMGYSSPSI